MSTVPIPQGATIGEPEQPKTVPIPEGAHIGDDHDEGFLHKAWRVINSPVADLISGAPGATKRAILGSIEQAAHLPPGSLSPENLQSQMQRVDPNHPAVQGLRTFVAGAAGDTADTAASFTSPLSLGTAALGAAGQAPGAVGKIAKAGGAVVGAGFSAKGAHDVYQAGLDPSPEAMQQRLQGGAMVAGGAAAAGAGAQALKPAAARALLLGRTPQEAYESALKPSTTIPEAQRARLVNAALDEGVPVSRQGTEVLSDKINQLNQAIKDVIATDPTRPVSPAAAAQNLNATEAKFATQVNPKSDLAAINDSRQEFLDQFRSTPGGPVRDMAADQAQAMKQGTYRVLGGKSYGEMKSASVEAQKALARGLKEEIARQFPEIESLNARESQLLDLQPVLERAVNRIGNHQLLGLGTPAAAGAAKVITGSGKLAAVAAVMKAVLDNPSVKSRLAIRLNKAGVPLSQATARINAYQSLLGNALSSAAESSQSRQQDQLSTSDGSGAYPNPPMP